MKPYDVNPDNEIHLLNTVYEFRKISYRAKFKIGVHFRFGKNKNICAKAYEPSWSSGIFIHSKIQHTNPLTCKITDLHGEVTKGGFYQFKLEKN